MSKFLRTPIRTDFALMSSKVMEFKTIFIIHLPYAKIIYFTIFNNKHRNIRQFHHKRIKNYTLLNKVYSIKKNWGERTNKSKKMKLDMYT